MVLAELGSSIKVALSKLHTSTVIDEEVLDAVLKEIATALLQADVNVRTVMTIRNNIKKTINLEELGGGMNKRKIIQKAVFDELCAMMGEDLEPYKPVKGKTNVIMFVGLQGSGKTTSCTKFAYHYQRRGWKTALVCADTFRAGAFDQLKQNATKCKVPFYGDVTETDPVKIAEDGVNQFKEEKYEMIIVDTSGRHMQESALFEEMQQVSKVVKPNDIIFVMDSTNGQGLADQAQAFHNAVDIGSVIITKLDGHAKGGGALSAVAATNSPVVFIGTGEHFDEFEPFKVKSFVSRLLGMGDVEGLLNSFKEAGLDKAAPEMVERLSKGVFTLRDMYSQFQNVMKMGSMSTMLSMIPGMSADLIPKGQEKEGIARLKRFCCLMDSMTDQELDSNKPLTDSSRQQRIARGAGVPLKEVSMLMDQHKMFSKMVGKMGKLGKGLDTSELARNPQAAMRKLQGAMDPRMLQQMGGQGNLMNMMKQMGNMDLSSMFGGGGMPGMPGMGGRGKKR